MFENDPSPLPEEEIIRIVYIDPDREDYEKRRAIIQARFQNYVDFTHFESFETGIAAVNTGRYDVLISELTQPDLSPQEVLERIAESPHAAEMPVIILSHLHELSFMKTALDLCADEFFHKEHFDDEIFLARLRNLFRREFRIKVVYKQINDSLHHLHVAHGDTLKEIRDLNELIGEMKKTLESEYEKKMRLEEEKNRMQSIFGLYVDPSIVRGIMNNEFSIEQKGTLQEITVLFSDIRGYTSIAEKMLPRDVISFLNEYFTSMTEIILGHGGMIDKYIGDAIMCLFGAPLSNPEHRDLALQAAVDMQMTFELWVKNWEKNYGISPGMGIGLASGMAVVGNVGSFQKLSYTAVGDTVNLAARLESIAKPGAVLISEDIYVHLGPEQREKYLFEGLEPVALKGKSGLYKTFSVSEKQS